MSRGCSHTHVVLICTSRYELAMIQRNKNVDGNIQLYVHNPEMTSQYIIIRITVTEYIILHLPFFLLFENQLGGCTLFLFVIVSQ